MFAKCLHIATNFHPFIIAFIKKHCCPPKRQRVYLCFYPLKPYRTAIVFFRILADANVLHITCDPLNALIYWHEENVLRLYASLSFCNGTNCAPTKTIVATNPFDKGIAETETEGLITISRIDRYSPQTATERIKYNRTITKTIRYGNKYSTTTRSSY